MEQLKNLFLDCFSIELPDVTGLDFDDPYVSSCTWLRQSPQIAHQYIVYQFKKARSDEERVEIAHTIQCCTEEMIEDLEGRQADATYPLFNFGQYFHSNTAEAILICRRCLQRMKQIIEAYEKQQATLNICEGAPPYTLQQFVMMIVVMMEALGYSVQHGGEISQIDFTKGVHAILKIPWPEKDQNSKILSYIKRYPFFGRVTPDKSIADLEAIRPFFVATKFQKAVEIIDRDIIRCKSKKKS